MNESISRGLGPRGLGDMRRKAVSLTDAPLVKSRPLNPEKKFVRIYEPTTADVDVADWVAHNRESLEQDLYAYGALLLRGFGIKSVADFEKVALAFYGELYGGYGDLPRAGTSESIYQSTPYPPDKPILYHNESSHLNSWPMKISFSCMQKAQEGGATPLLDCRDICNHLDPVVFKKFAEKGLMYVRTFTEGIDVSWRDFFHTEDKAAVEQMCREAEVEFDWTDRDGLRTRQITHGVAKHPKTGDTVFFNQVQLHHISCLDKPVRESLLSLFGEEFLPRNVYYGDGSTIEDSVMEHIGEVFEQHAVRFDWQEGDIALLDNMLTSHARDTYVGPRRIVVAMGQMMSRDKLQ
ncbi:MAG TPA: TauD/TfdA family dioxygenase [Chthonomonadaceae bacterium]|nr:TauD/TfdA family dioxygenase [Chthonomonadaceae bacterium]